MIVDFVALRFASLFSLAFRASFVCTIRESRDYDIVLFENGKVVAINSCKVFMLNLLSPTVNSNRRALGLKRLSKSQLPTLTFRSRKLFWNTTQTSLPEVVDMTLLTPVQRDKRQSTSRRCREYAVGSNLEPKKPSQLTLAKGELDNHAE